MTAPAGVVLDMEGVLHVGWRPLPGVPGAVVALRGAGLELAVLTNTTGRSRAEIAGRLDGMGIEIPADRVVTAAWAAARHLADRHPGAAVFLLGEPGGREEFAATSLVDDPAEADVVLLGGPTEAWDYAILDRVFRRLLDGAPLVAMQRNRWWPTGEGPRLDAGPFVVGLEYAAGVEATVVGKPAPDIYRTACELLRVEPARALMVGDDPESDLGPAAAVGMRTCLVRTGKGATFTVAPGAVDLDLPDLAALPAALWAA